MDYLHVMNLEKLAATVEFTADESGVFAFYCSEFCSALHLEMAGYFLVKPKS